MAYDKSGSDEMADAAPPRWRFVKKKAATAACGVAEADGKAAVGAYEKIGDKDEGGGSDEMVEAALPRSRFVKKKAATAASGAAEAAAGGADEEVGEKDGGDAAVEGAAAGASTTSGAGAPSAQEEAVALQEALAALAEVQQRVGLSARAPGGANRDRGRPNSAGFHASKRTRSGAVQKQKNSEGSD